VFIQKKIKKNKTMKKINKKLFLIFLVTILIGLASSQCAEKQSQSLNFFSETDLDKNDNSENEGDISEHKYNGVDYIKKPYKEALNGGAGYNGDDNGRQDIAAEALGYTKEDENEMVDRELNKKRSQIKHHRKASSFGDNSDWDESVTVNENEPTTNRGEAASKKVEEKKAVDTKVTIEETTSPKKSRHFRNRSKSIDYSKVTTDSPKKFNLVKYLSPRSSSKADSKQK
jgi:hypothetical protein